MRTAPTSAYVLRRVPVNNKAEVLVDDQELNDIIKAIKKYHKVHKTQYDDISENFWQGDAAATSKVLFDFLKTYITYKVEPEADQSIKSPGRMIHDGRGDCKHYASFICGVVDSLERKGYPIHSCYRFVSDIPGRDVHHVFGVVSDSHGDYWVDPVLPGFDQRPTFYNTKDIAFSNGIGRLRYLSGTQAASMGDYELGEYDYLGAGGKGKAKVKAAVKKVTTATKKAVQNVAKGAKNTVKKVTHVAVKVASTPARNAFLALVDLNFANLATRLSNALKGPKSRELQETWKKLGGNPAKLQSAVNNGLKFKAKLHKGKGKSVKGFDCCVGMGAVYHSDIVTTHPKRWVQEHYMRKHRRRRCNDNSMLSGDFIGFEPVSTASLMALASAILAVLAKFIGPTTAEMAAMTDQAEQGAAEIVDRAAAATTAEGDFKADQLDRITTPSGGADATMSVKTGLDEYGQPQVTVDDVRHPAVTYAGGDDGGAGADTPAPQKGFLDDFTQKAEAAWTNHKGKIITGTVIFLLLSSKKVRKKIGLS